jgi:predicted amidophosphoribosyltransferase
MEKPPTQIGRCKGCNKHTILDDGVCPECLNGPNRGRKWAELAYKCRQDPAYAKKVYSSINTESGRKLFIMMFGTPNPPNPSNHPGQVLQFSRKS